jgi:hypothetical protein
MIGRNPLDQRSEATNLLLKHRIRFPTFVLRDGQCPRLGRLALDVNTPWRRRPLPYGLAGFALAVVMSAITLVLFR